MEKIDRYVIEYVGGLFSSIKNVYIRDRLEYSRICEFNTDNKSLNKKLAEECLKIIEKELK